jgi:hypothetical protein
VVCSFTLLKRVGCLWRCDVVFVCDCGLPAIPGHSPLMVVFVECDFTRASQQFSPVFLHY